jgi:hypothetical protein
VLLALVLSLAIYTCSSLYGDKHSLPLPALRDYVSHLARAAKYLVGHKPKIRPTPIYVAPRESAARRQRPISLMDIRQAADNLVRLSAHRSHATHSPAYAHTRLTVATRVCSARGRRLQRPHCSAGMMSARACAGGHDGHGGQQQGAAERSVDGDAEG